MTKHRHDFKHGKREKIFGSLYHIHCDVKDCKAFKTNRSNNVYDEDKMLE